MTSRLIRYVIISIPLAYSTMALMGCQRQAASLFDDPHPYPEFIDAVQPFPGSRFDLSEPGDRNLYYSSNQFVGDICVEILEQPLLRPNDHFYEFNNVSLKLDGEVINADQFHAPTDEPVEGLEDSVGNITATGVYSDLICWNIEIQPGIHVAEILVWTSTDEEFSYSWAFKAVR